MPARRPGKLPPETISATYALEYGQNALELHPDMVPHGSRVLIHDDVLATGGTVEAIAEQLVERLGGIVVGCCFIIELSFLKGRERPLQLRPACPDRVLVRHATRSQV